MSQRNFVIASHSFLINKGLSSLIREFRNHCICEILESSEALEESLRTHQPNFLLISTEILKDINPLQFNNLYKISPTTEIIQISHNHESVPNYPTISIHWSRKEIMHFFTNLQHRVSELESMINSELSEREKVILAHVATGKTNKEIADFENISIHTVITHRKNITAKLGIKSISGLTVYAIFNGLIAMEDVE